MGSELATNYPHRKSGQYHACTDDVNDLSSTSMCSISAPKSHGCILWSYDRLHDYADNQLRYAVSERHAGGRLVGRYKDSTAQRLRSCSKKGQGTCSLWPLRRLNAELGITERAKYTFLGPRRKTEDMRQAIVDCKRSWAELKSFRLRRKHAYHPCGQRKTSIAGSQPNIKIIRYIALATVSLQHFRSKWPTRWQLDGHR